MKKQYGTITLIICTAVVLILNIANLIEFLDTGYTGSTFSNVCFIGGDICIIFGWITYFLEKKKKA